ncbi:unnamed protein product [Bathycoccus prasinos]
MSSVGLGKGVGIPVKLMHESEGHVITVELKSGELYRGTLVEAEDNWNCQLTNVSHTARDGKTETLVVGKLLLARIENPDGYRAPDMLKNAPMFKKIDPRTKSVLAGGGKK